MRMRRLRQSTPSSWRDEMLKAAILGATGAVGQRFVQLLDGHPWFEAAVLCASERSVGKHYGEACNWILRETPMPERAKGRNIFSCTPKDVEKAGGADLIFSCLPGELAGPAEEEFAKAGYPVFSKASAHRFDEDVPLLIPEVNPDHIRLVEMQRKKRGWKGFISTDPNCSTTHLVISLAPLLQFGLTDVIVTTLQALSGAGYPGVASLDIIDNVIPYISGEEKKIETETLKLLGRLEGGKVAPFPLRISASCNRVFVREGHMECVYARLQKRPSLDEIREAWDSFEGEPQKLKLPSACKPIIVREEPDRPQHRYDVNEGKGMTTVVGRLREDKVLGYKYVCLGHNTIRGAAGEAILQAEFFKAKGYL